MSRKLFVISIAGVVLSLFALTTRTYAQATGADQLVAKNVGVAASKSGEVSNASPSPEALQAQIRAQQMELNELREHVKKLEAMLEAVAANQQARTTAGTADRAQTPTMIAAAQPDAVNGPRLRMFREDQQVPAPSGHIRRLNPGKMDRPRELLPDIGQIGAQVGLLVGGSTNPFQYSTAGFHRGYIDLPVKKVAGGKNLI